MGNLEDKQYLILEEWIRLKSANQKGGVHIKECVCSTDCTCFDRTETRAAYGKDREGQVVKDV